ncbi:MAG: phage holin family protein [Prevotella sp.]|nr:phage holin family protein [Prevotella sp.]
MLSNDKNIETIAQLVEELKNYVELQKDFVKLDVIDKAVRLLTAASLFVVAFLFLLAIMLYISFAAIYWMAPQTGMAEAFAIMGGAYTLLLALLFVFRKKLIERPLVRCFANILLS